MKRKRHHRTGSDGPVEEQQLPRENAEDEVEDRLEAAAGAAMPEDGDGDGEQGDGNGDGDGHPDARHHEHSDHPVSDSMAERRPLAVEVEMALGDAEAVEEEFALTDMVPNMRRFVFFFSWFCVVR